MRNACRGDTLNRGQIVAIIRICLKATLILSSYNDLILLSDPNLEACFIHIIYIIVKNTVLLFYGQ
jgi:hypothetical protein